MRDIFLLEGGCCLAELLGCGVNLLLAGPSVGRQILSAGTRSRSDEPVTGSRGRVLAFSLDAIRAYQTEISPRRGACCRFTPTCSHYAAQALETYGLGRGTRLAVRRLSRCRPGGAGGADPVPPPTE
ncbi:MAG: membrane protein insertion efficiency factor YidD [Pseudonocardiales bacterium]|nr:membrane protein insertion efficiency factor YidD [Actinomycetota bacterium]